MTICNLEGLTSPRSIAIVGPNSKQEMILQRLIDSLISSQFAGHKTLIGLPETSADGFQNLSKIPDVEGRADLAILLGDHTTAPDVIRQLGEQGTRAVVIPASGFDSWRDEHLDALLKAAHPFNIRILGPGSLGIASPHSKLSTLLTQEQALKGELALISRSGTIFNTTLSWAKANSIGFSGVVSLGRRLDVDVSDLLDWYAQDYKTKAILVHLETIANPRKFLSAARAAARTKPVIVIRSGSSRDQHISGTTHSSRLATRDSVYDAALQRAGVLRVYDLDEMFEAAETITRVAPSAGRRLSIIANGRSLATLAADRLTKVGGRLAPISDETKAKLGKLTRTDAVADNPLVLSESASPEEFKEGIDALLRDPNSDGVLAIAAPTAFVDFAEVAKAIADAAKDDRKRLGKHQAFIATLAGGSNTPRHFLDEARVPCYPSPSGSIRSFMHLVRYKEARDQLSAVPDSLPSDYKPNLRLAKETIRSALAEGQKWLTPLQTRDLLQAYLINQVELHLVKTVDEAARVATYLFKKHAQLVLKLSSPDLTFKSDVGGVHLGVDSVEGVRATFEKMLKNVTQSYPNAAITGVEIQPMVSRRFGLETYAGLADDPVFGPVVVFGKGGTSVEVVGDRAIDLVPIDLNLARAMVSRTSTSKLLKGFRNRPSADISAVEHLLVKLSQIAVDFPEVRELDLNPVVADEKGIVVLDARVAISPPEKRPGRQGASRLSIVPYPIEWEHTHKLKDGKTVLIRPIRPEDQGTLRKFFEKVSIEDLRLRFFAPVKEFSHTFLARLVQLDYARAMAFAAIDPENGEILGVVRLHANPDHTEGEYAVMVQSNLKGIGLGWILMKLIIRYAKVDGIQWIKGEVLRENTTMLDMCRSLGFRVKRSPDDDALADVVLDVTALDREAVS
ncbi:bifunctional acetate--CoA ligase family protein/GNAT family N-acetyltransferase [Pseudovibrio sp. Tun.PSC04-5.I4]|uniref:bifunctional acetate--CoA ligase family protein/GNAT family N-acetyltransferase n=1 Tax=Pseudovibrio sp. Tun.PSC04-5.I4 TaxID=1798213 RepID=UPI000883DF9B|nr:bifunctional acetate--CoA ligase family protein/GNAT family N-acetyltransferase [Pseudovibrio sp. Tun.PSC04-5.I4]SDQ77353.1 acetyltransferase [Pseudovibrio sp. Tun.PSC04-5.I4]